MTRCPDLYDKLDRDGNFCGLSSSAISKIKAYRELIDKIEKAGIDRAFAYENFSEGASRAITSLNDDESRGKGLNYVIARLKQKEKITAPELKKMVAEWLNSGSTDGNLGDVSKKLPIVRTPTEQKPSFPVEKPAPTGQTLTEKMAAQPQQPVFYKPDPAPVSEIVPIPAPITSQDPEKQRSSALNYYAKEFYKLLSERTKKNITDILTDNPTWEVKDVFFFGVQALIDKKNGAKK